MAKMCPACANRVAGALVLFRRLRSHQMDYLTHMCTAACSPGCNEAVWRLRSIRRLHVGEILQEMIVVLGWRPGSMTSFPSYLRFMALWWGRPRALRWLYRHFRRYLPLLELKLMCTDTFDEFCNAQRVRCYLYLQAWVRSQGASPPASPALKSHWSAMLIQKRWRRAVADPAFTLCRKRLLAEFAELIDTPVW